jgi:murein DD-endopeptidase MepM/ murein hydrolase activator NlpD
MFYGKKLLTIIYIWCEKYLPFHFLVLLMPIPMVPIDSPRKHTRLLVIAIIILSLTGGRAHAASKTTAVKKAQKAKTTVATKKTSTKTQVKGERITATSVSVIGDNTISTYTVKSGDTLSGIAQKFDISVNTIRSSNDIDSKDSIHVGEKITILPMSGVVYTVKSGDTLSGIAVKFDADQNDILNSNDLDDADSLKVGMKLIIPEAEPLDAASASSSDGTIGPMENISPIAVPSSATTQTPVTIPVAVSIPAQQTQTPATGTEVVTNPVTTATYAITVTAPTINTPYPIPADDIRGYYAQPISGRLSQGIHAVNAVDIAAPIGTTVHAAANGTVIVAMGNGKYNGGYGNYIVISHPNGTQTLYAHLSEVTVSLGEMVLQGQPIALSGNTGDTTGPHLHFEIRGAANPWGTDPLGTEYTI